MANLYLGIFKGLKLLCRDEFISKYSSSLVYRWREAEILDIDMSDINQYRLLIHFIGWSNRFDLWLDIIQDIHKIAPINMIDTENAYKGTALTKEQLEKSIKFFQILNKNVMLNSNSDNGIIIDNSKADSPKMTTMSSYHENSRTSLLDIDMNQLIHLDKSNKEYPFVLKKRLNLFKIGSKIEVLDIYYKKGSITPSYKWRVTEVIHIKEDDGIIKIHYVNWSDRYDEELHIIFDANRLRDIPKAIIISTTTTTTNDDDDDISHMDILMDKVTTSLRSSIKVIENISIDEVSNTFRTSMKNITTDTISFLDDTVTDNPLIPDEAIDHYQIYLEMNEKLSNNNRNEKENSLKSDLYSNEIFIQENNKDTNIKTNMNNIHEKDIKIINTNKLKQSVNNNDSTTTSIPCNNSKNNNNNDDNNNNNNNKILKTFKTIIRIFIIQKSKKIPIPISIIEQEDNQINPTSTYKEPEINGQESIINENERNDHTMNNIMNNKDEVENNYLEIEEMKIKQKAMILRDKQFISALESKGLYIYNIQSDGNCLFRAVSHQLYLNEDKHVDLRKKVVQHLIEHRDRFELFCDQDYDEYINEMKQMKTWGDDLEIRALEEITDRLIRIYRSDQDNFDEPTHDNEEERYLLQDVLPIVLSYHGSNHYNSVYNEKHALPLPLRTSKVLLRSRMSLNNMNDISLRIESSISNVDNINNEDYKNNDDTSDMINEDIINDNSIQKYPDFYHHK